MYDMIALSKNTAAAWFQHAQPKSIHTTVWRHQTIYQSAADSQKRWFKNNDVFFRLRLVWLWLVATRRPLRGEDESQIWLWQIHWVGNWRLLGLMAVFRSKKRLAASLCLWKLRLGRKVMSFANAGNVSTMLHKRTSRWLVFIFALILRSWVMGQWDLIFCKNNCFLLWMATKILSQTIERPLACTSRIKPLHGLQTPRSEGSSTQKATVAHRDEICCR